MTNTRKRKSPDDVGISQPAKKPKVLPQQEDDKTLGQEAIRYAKRYIMASSTLPTEKNRAKIEQFSDTILSVRARIPDPAEAMYLILMYPMNPTWRNIRRDVINAKRFFIGNCGEYTSLAFNFFRKKNVRRADYLHVGSNHLVAVLNMQGDVNQRSTWDCTYVDGLNNSVFDNSESDSKLMHYQFDWNQADPHILRPVNDNDKLFIQYTIGCKTPLTDNQFQIKNHQMKLELIKTACENHLTKEKLAEFHALFNTLDIPNDEQLNEMTNFDLERKMEKQMKKLCRFIGQLPHNDSEAIFAEIILKFADMYPSYYDYFEDLFEISLFNIVSTQIRNKAVGTERLIAFLSQQQHLHNFFIYAARINHVSAILFCLDKSVDASGLLSGSLLRLAAGYGFIDALKLLLSQPEMQYKINEQDNSGCSALHYAVVYGRAEAVNILLENGADFNSLSQANETPITLATRLGLANIVNIFHDFQIKPATTLAFNSLFASNDNDEEHIFELIPSGDNEESPALISYNEEEFLDFDNTFKKAFD
jgi:ankyrin repeat protein